MTTRADEALELLRGARRAIVGDPPEPGLRHAEAVLEERLPARVAAGHHARLVARFAQQLLRAAERVLGFLEAPEHELDVRVRMNVAHVGGRVARLRVATRGDERDRFGEAAVEHARGVGVVRRRIGERGGGGEIECRKHGGSSRQAVSNTMVGSGSTRAPGAAARRGAQRMDACRYRLVRAESAQQFVTFRYDWRRRRKSAESANARRAATPAARNIRRTRLRRTSRRPIR